MERLIGVCWSSTWMSLVGKTPSGSLTTVKWRGTRIVERNFGVQGYEFRWVITKPGYFVSAYLATGNAGRYPAKSAGGRLHDGCCQRYRLHDAGQRDAIIECIHRIEAQLTEL